MSHFIVRKQTQTASDPMWVAYDPQRNDNTFPRPNLEAIQLRSCFACKSTKMGLVRGVTSNGVVQFKAVCQTCGDKSGAISYARDPQSMAAFVMPFGKNKGRTLGEIESQDSGYLDWCLENMTDEKLLGTIVIFRRVARQ